ncbi:MAG: polysaccharide deacetylase family protein [Nitrospira sp.]
MKESSPMDSIKMVGRQLAAKVYAHSPGFLRALNGRVVILTYHRVVSSRELERECIQPGMYVLAETFAAQMKFLKAHFMPVSFMQLLELWQGRGLDPTTRYCVVTFDDGWLDNYTYALPVLKAYDVAATIFLPTGYVGTNEWFWPERFGWILKKFVRHTEEERERLWSVLKSDCAWCEHLSDPVRRGDYNGVIEWCKRIDQKKINDFLGRWAEALGVEFPADRQVMNWSEVREMSAQGISFGSHSVTHGILTTLSSTEVDRELRDSWAKLREQLIRSIPVFCYPNGDWSDQIGESVKAAGYLAAATTRHGCEGANPSHLYGLNRINVHQHVTYTDELFGFYLAGAPRAQAG